MPQLKQKVPKLCRHHKGQGFVKINGKQVWLGRYGDPTTRERYDRLIAEWLANGRELPEPEEDDDAEPLTLTELCLSYWRHVKAKKIQSEAEAIQSALRVARDLYGSEPAASFGPKRLRLVREQMVWKGWARKSINKQCSRIRAMFKWAASHELLPYRAYERLTTLEPLRKGDAEDRPPVRPVARSIVRRTRRHLARQVRGLVDLQILTGARAAELTGLKPVDLEISGKVWTYRPEDHKTAHHGHERVIYFGPRAQRILGLFLTPERAVDRPIFSPKDAEAERYAKCKTHQQEHPSRKPNPRKTDRTLGDAYTTTTYRRAIHHACDHAFAPPEHLARGKVPGKGRKRKTMRWETDAEWRKRLGPEKWAELKAWQREHRWSPHRLRHNAATFLRREFGIEAAKVILGHSNLSVTQIYAERDHRKAMQIMAEVG